MGPRRGSYQPVVPADLPDAILPGARAEAYGRANSIPDPDRDESDTGHDAERSGLDPAVEVTAGEHGEGGGQT